MYIGYICLDYRSDMKIRHIVIVVIFVLINVLVLATLNFKPKEDKPVSEDKVFVQNLQAIEVNTKTEIFNVQGFGTISSFNTVDVSSEVQGKLIQGRYDLKSGIRFKKGDLLYRVDDTEARYNLRSRVSGFIKTIATMLPDIKIDFPEEFDKWNDYIADIKLNEALPQLPAWKTNKEKIFLSTRNILTEYFTIKSSEEQLKKFQVSAPFSGMIKEVFVANHAVVNPGSRVMTIVQTGNFEIAVSIPAGQLDAIEIGSKCDVFTTGGELKGSGKVVRVSDVINRNTQSVTVYVKPTALEGQQFVEGEYLKVAIDETGEFTGSRIPQNALIDNMVYVYDATDSTLSKQEVAVLDKNQDGYFVSGLKNKQVVITQEVMNYNDSTKYGVLIKSK